MSHLFNVRLRHVGGISFLQIGRFHFSWCVSREFRDWRYPPTACTSLVPYDASAHPVLFANVR